MTPKEKVQRHMKIKYNVELDNLRITNTPGYWEDKEPKMHKSHPLHSCIGNDGPFKASYTYFDNDRCYKTGRFISRYRTWKALKNQEKLIKHD